MEAKHRHIALSLVLGAAGTWAVASHQVPAGPPLTLGATLGVLAGALALAAVLHRWVLPGTRSRLAMYSRSGRVFWLLGCTLLAWLLFRALPLTSPKPQAFGSLTLTATGKRNPQAVSAEVWVTGLSSADGREVPPDAWERTGDWELRERAWLSHQNQPATLRWQGWIPQPLTLEVVSHDYSGILEYEWNGERHEIDLYHPEGKRLRLELPRAANAPAPSHRVMRFIFHASHVAALATFLLVTGLWLASRQGERRAEPRPTFLREGPLYALPSLVSGVVWLLAVFPALMSPDSTDQWHQAISGGHMHDAHPLLHTLLIRWLSQVWTTPAVVATVQLLAFGALVGWGCVSLRQAGLSRTGAWLTALVLGLSPVNGTLINTIWKDIPFSLTVLALSILLFRAAELRDETSRRGFWVSVAVFSILTIHMRHNGAPVVLGTFMGLLLLERHRWKRVALLFVLVMSAALGSRKLLLRAYDVPPVESGITLIGYLGAHVAAGTELRDDERAILDDIHPLDDRWNYLCFTNVTTVFDGRFDMDAVRRYKDALPGLLIELTRRNYRPTLNHATCASSMLWKLSQGRDHLNGPAIWRRPTGELATIYESPVSPKPAPVLPDLSKRMLDLAAKTMEPDLAWFFWRPALPLYLALLACAVMCLRQRSWHPTAVLMPILLHTLALALLIPSPDVRYQYPVILVGQMFALAWLLLPRQQEVQDPPGTSTAS
ncbi:hypothetical protein [Archangium sp.]|uniref:hypothetical protein n=1 Tax=Archangium sp. TaxID=1872627 RepID=UPI002D42AF2A|nr:hypothetical protein [Archangium sp.]HYO58515.1 hypothetical protein [Archangium sp.]